MVVLPSIPGLLERFGAVMAAVRRAVTGEGHPVWVSRPRHVVPPEVSRLVTLRLAGIGEKLAALVARLRAGRLRPRLTVSPGQEGGRGASPRASPRASHWAAADVAQLPRTFGWLREMVPALGDTEMMIAGIADETEMRQLAAAAPSAMRRVVSPLYWMLGVQLPSALRPVPKPGARTRSLPQLPSVRASSRANHRIHAAYVKAQAALAAAGVAPPSSPLPYGFSHDPDSIRAPDSWGGGTVQTKRR